MKLDQIHTVYLIGIGGIGMSALARYFNSIGKNVSGYDRASTPLTQKLNNEGIDVHFEDNIELLQHLSKENTIVIYTPAIPKTLKEYIFFINKDFEVYKRAEILGLISKNSFNLAIAGTHGKTTTSSLLTFILDKTEKSANGFLGGIATDYNSNLVLNSSAKNTVMEADEFDRSFLHLSPNIALITSIDPDHLDIYNTPKEMIQGYQQFADLIPKDGVLILQESIVDKIKTKAKLLTYGFNSKSDFFAEQIEILDGIFVFKLNFEGQTIKVKLGLPGLHNLENALGAFAIAYTMGLSPKVIINKIRLFKGIKRRFEQHIIQDELIYIDDYAHHPTEIKTLIKSLRLLYPGKKITGIFQPHLFSRTKDFEIEFAEELSKLDTLHLMDIYPAREEPIDGINAVNLLKKINLNNKKIFQKDQFLTELKETKGVLVTIGAGSIDQLIQPIIEKLNS